MISLPTSVFGQYFYTDHVLEKVRSEEIEAVKYVETTRNIHGPEIADKLQNGDTTSLDGLGPVGNFAEELHIRQSFVKMSLHHVLITLPFAIYFNFM